MPCFLYVCVQDENKIVGFDLDPGTGQLAPRAEVPAAGGPSVMTISPDRRMLYVGHRGEPAISGFLIDPVSGGLTQRGTVATSHAPTFLATDRTGKFLLSAYYQGGLAGVHPLAEDGSVGPIAIEWLATATGAHAIQTDRSNRFVFVPHIARLNDNVLEPLRENIGPNMISQFKFDSDSGHLAANSPPRIELAERLGPRHYCFHPTRDLVFFSNEQGCGVTSYRLDTITGTLSPVQTISSLPEGHTARNTCSQIHLTPSGQFLYVANRGHNSIAGFAVDPATGRLAPVGQVLTEAVPSSFCLDPAGHFLFAAGTASGRLASYRINSQSGSLTPLTTYAVGQRPAAVLVSRLGD